MKLFKIEYKLLVVLTSVIFLLSCEHDESDIGGNLFPNQSTGNKTYVDLVAYNVSNNDSVRADAATLTKGVVGVYEDNTFGKAKAAFNTQIRLSGEGIAGTEQVVDSVVLSVFPDYDANQSKEYLKNMILPGGQQAVKSRKQYPLTQYLGKGKNGAMTLEVNRIETSLGSSDTKHYSNDAPVQVGALLGSRKIADSVESVTIKSINGDVITAATTPGYSVNLDKTYFQQHFFDKKGSPEVSDNNNFVNYFKGIKLSVKEGTSAFMFNFPKTTMKLVAYYRYKNNASEANYTSAIYTFTTNSADNASKGEYAFDRSTASGQFTSQVNAPNKVDGESLLFLQGMGGPSINLKLDDQQLNEIRKNVQENNWTVIGASIKFHLAEDTESKPQTIFGYANNNGKGYFLPDVNSLSGLPGYVFNPVYDFSSNPGYYILNVTQHVKNIVEKNKTNDEIIINIGNFQMENDGRTYLGYYRNTKSYEPFRLVFNGNKASDINKKLQLEIIYTSK